MRNPLFICISPAAALARGEKTCLMRDFNEVLASPVFFFFHTPEILKNSNLKTTKIKKKKKCGTRCLREVLSANGYQLPFAHRTYSPRRNLAITTTSHLLQAHLHYPQQLAAHPIELRPHSPYRNPATSTTSHLRQAHLHYPQHLAPDKFLDT